MPRFHRLKSPLQNVWTPWQQDFEIKLSSEWSLTRCFHDSYDEVWTFWTLNISNQNDSYLCGAPTQCCSFKCFLHSHAVHPEGSGSWACLHIGSVRPTKFTDPTRRLQKLCDYKNRILTEREVESLNEICVNTKHGLRKRGQKVTQTRNLHFSRAFLIAAGNHNPTWMWRLWRFVCSETTVAHHGHCSLEGPAPGVPAQTNWTMETDSQEMPCQICDWMWLIDSVTKYFKCACFAMCASSVFTSRETSNNEKTEKAFASRSLGIRDVMTKISPKWTLWLLVRGAGPLMKLTVPVGLCLAGIRHRTILLCQHAICAAHIPCQILFLCAHHAHLS